MAEIKWMSEPEAHDYDAARDYLSLIFEPSMSRTLAREFQRETEIKVFKAKDILRASGLPALPASNAHVAKDLDKIHRGKELSPILLVRSQPLIVADGYHRVCACYLTDENAEIHCKIV